MLKICFFFILQSEEKTMYILNHTAILYNILQALTLQNKKKYKKENTQQKKSSHLHYSLFNETPLSYER